MLYDKKMEGKKAIIINTKDGRCYTIFACRIGEFDACLLTDTNRMQAILSDKKGILISNNPIEITLCESIIISRDSVTVEALRFSENSGQHKNKIIGCYSLNLDNVDLNIKSTNGIINIDDVESINANSQYFIGLLNAGVILIDDDVMRLYDLMPRWVLHRNNSQNSKKYIK